MSKKYRVLWSSKVLIFWVIVAILLFFTNTSTHAINFLVGNNVGFFHEIPYTYLAGPGGYYLGPAPPNGILTPQVLYIEGEPRGYSFGTGGYYPGSIYSHYYNREGVYNPEPYPFLTPQVLYIEGEPRGYSFGTGGYYPGSFYSHYYNREGVYNPEPYPFLTPQVLYIEGEPRGYSFGTGGYYPGSFYSRYFD